MATNKVFQQAEDTQTIIMHMCEPVELERQVFKKKYRSFQDKYINVAKAKMKDVAITSRQRCQEFVNMVTDAIQDKGEQKADITKAQKQDFLEYMYGWLMKDMTTKQLYEPLQAKKAVFERHELFDEQIILPTYP